MDLALLLAKGEKYPEVPEGLSAELGWMVFAGVLLLFIWMSTRAEWVRRGLLRKEDPRIFAVLRIGFGLCTIQCFWNLEPYWRLLWSDEGMFTLVEAQQRLGRGALSGWTPQEGFFDGWALIKYFTKKHSIFLLHGSPAFVRLYLYVFTGFLLLFMVGFRSRVTGLFCWFMMHEIYNRNGVYLEGTDTVYRTMWLMVILAQTDRAWSVDNLLRVWREKRALRQAKKGVFFDLPALLDRYLSWLWFALWAGLYSILLGELAVYVFAFCGMGVLTSW